MQSYVTHKSRENQYKFREISPKAALIEWTTKQSRNQKRREKISAKQNYTKGTLQRDCYLANEGLREHSKALETLASMPWTGTTPDDLWDIINSLTRSEK